jgi:outer membrane receptor protein involved in Fe transport
VLLDGRTVYLDFFGIVLWDLLPANMNEIQQIEVIRGPASAVWGANAMTGVVNIITKSPREAPGGEASFTGGFMSRDAGSGVGKGAGGLFGANASLSAAPNKVWSYRVSGGYFSSDAFPRPAGTIPVITDPEILLSRSEARPIRPMAPARLADRLKTAARASRSSTCGSIRNCPTAAG